MYADCSRMPPRCCTFVQIHTIARILSPYVAKTYREKFEEWVSTTKTYCPAPACSAFISERQIPQSTTAQTKPPSPLPTFLQDILATVQEHSSARFFRGEMDITQLPGYNNVVERPIDLGKISANIPRYDTVNSLTSDMQLLVSNACSYNGPGHPVSKAADELFRHYLRALSEATSTLAGHAACCSQIIVQFPVSEMPYRHLRILQANRTWRDTVRQNFVRSRNCHAGVIWIQALSAVQGGCQENVRLLAHAVHLRSALVLLVPEEYRSVRWCLLAARRGRRRGGAGLQRG